MRESPGELVLDARPTPTPTLLRALWRSRQLIAILARKDFYVRYRRASFGMLWAVGLPLIQAAVLAVVFSQFRKGEAPGGSFAAYVISGFLVWSFFATVIGGGSTAVVEGKGLSTRIYFPRAVLPLVHVAANLYSFAVTTVIMSAIVLVAHGSIEPTLPLIVPALALEVAFAAALCLTLSALHVYFRDVRYVVAAIMQPWFFLTPIIWNSSQLPEWIRGPIRLNPAAGFVELTRLALIGEAGEGWGTSVVSCIVCVVVLTALALYLYTRYDRVFSDLL